MTCNQGHGEISYRKGKCPLCRALEQNRKLSHTVSQLHFDLLVTETEMLLDFEAGEKKIFSCVGQT